MPEVFCRTAILATAGHHIVSELATLLAVGGAAWLVILLVLHGAARILASRESAPDLAADSDREPARRAGRLGALRRFLRRCESLSFLMSVGLLSVLPVAVGAMLITALLGGPAIVGFLIVLGCGCGLISILLAALVLNREIDTLQPRARDRRDD